MVAFLNMWRQMQMWLDSFQSMHIYLKYIPVKFHHNPIWNKGALGFFKDDLPNNHNHNNKNKMSSDRAAKKIREVTDSLEE